MGRGIGDRQALLRAGGGVLLAVGVLVLLSRRSATHQWTRFELMLLIAAPAALLYTLALRGAPSAGGGPGEMWRSVLLVTAVLLVPVSLFLLLDWAGANTKHLLYDAAVLAATAVIAILGARRTRAPFAFLLAGLALLSAWLLVWFKILHDPSADTVRWMLLGGGALLLGGASIVTGFAERGLGGAELAVAGGLGAVSAGVLGILVSGFGAVTALTSATSGGSESTVTVESSGTVTATGGAPVVSETTVTPPHTTNLIAPHFSGGQTLGWDIYLLTISLALVLTGSRGKARGLVYVGVLGLLFFIDSVGTQLSRLLAGHSPSSSLAGWPLVLIVLGLVGLAASWTRQGRGRNAA